MRVDTVGVDNGVALGCLLAREFDPTHAERVKCPLHGRGILSATPGVVGPGDHAPARTRGCPLGMRRALPFGGGAWWLGVYTIQASRVVHASPANGGQGFGQRPAGDQIWMVNRVGSFVGTRPQTNFPLPWPIVVRTGASRCALLSSLRSAIQEGRGISSTYDSFIHNNSPVLTGAWRQL